MNRMIETFKRCLVVQQNTSKSYASQNRLWKVVSSIIEISESVHWSRRCYAISFI